MTNNLRVSLNRGLKRVRLVLLILVGACGLALAQPVAAADPTAEPILRVETGMHTTMIRRLVVDAPRNRLITCSDDKTVRIWQMPEARLISTLRAPIDVGHEGQLFAIAISPDGNTVVAGGWTGWDWDGVSSIYFFDVATGDLIRRHSGFKDAISTLTWTRDGKHLIVGLQARAGLHLLRLSDMSIVASDTEYLDKIMEVVVRAVAVDPIAAQIRRVAYTQTTINSCGKRPAELFGQTFLCWQI